MPKGVIRRRAHLLKVLSISFFIVLVLTVSGCRRIAEPAAREIPDSLYMRTGDMIVRATFDSLRNSLITAIGTHGVAGAITFCNANASALTDSYADTVTVRRTALRYRNPKNKPDSLEHIVLMTMLSRITSSKTPEPLIIRADRKVHYFRPIMTQSMCLNCHGNPGAEIKESTMSKIRELYPDDRAVNFREGDLRGVWHILFND